MKILAIESSCDETSAAVLDDTLGIKVISNITATSMNIHASTGGIIPENAARLQVKYILPIIIEALLKSKNIKKTNANRDFLKANEILQKSIDAIAVTYGPGLIGSLLVGVETAKTLAYVFDKPLIPVNHLLAHIYANFIFSSMQKNVNAETLSNKIVTTSSKFNNEIFPFIGLIVSGGHTDLLLFKNHGDYQWLGGTRDDAAGECFDKCARLLGYDYPGGPKISKLAEKGNAKNVSLPKVMVGNGLDFSFSGLKTAFMHIVSEEFEVSKSPNEKGYSWSHTIIENLPDEKKQLLYDLCASLEQTIAEVLVRKTLKAAEKYSCQTILVGGGVSANEKFKQELQDRSQKSGIKTYFPEKEYCTDNAAMIGAYALHNFKELDWSKVTADPELYFA